jgi:hypothetical protein
MEQQVGVEPDESYCIGTDKEFPDLFKLLSECVQNLNPLAAAKTFRQGIRDTKS